MANSIDLAWQRARSPVLSLVRSPSKRKDQACRSFSTLADHYLVVTLSRLRIQVILPFETLPQERALTRTTPVTCSQVPQNPGNRRSETFVSSPCNMRRFQSTPVCAVYHHLPLHWTNLSFRDRYAELCSLSGIHTASKDVHAVSTCLWVFFHKQPANVGKKKPARGVVRI